MNLAELIGELQKLKLDAPRRDTDARPSAPVRIVTDDGDAYDITDVAWSTEDKAFIIDAELADAE